MDIFLTLDVFFRDYERISKSSTRELWLCVQPHVLKTDFEAWVGSINAPVSHTYRWLDQTPGSATGALGPDSLLPVTLAPQVDLTLRLLDLLDHEVIPPLVNHRTTALNIDDPDTFEAWNRDRLQSHTSTIDAKPRKTLPGPFAASFAAGIVSMYATDPSTVQNFIKLGFYGGTRRRLPASAVSHQTDVALFLVDDTAEAPHGAATTANATNLHSLCGLMFKLSTGDADRVLANVVDLELAFTASATAKLRLGSGTLATAMQGIFGTLNRPIAVPQIQLSWSPDYTQRLYVKDAVTPFAPVACNGTTYFRRQSTTSVDATKLRLDAVRSLLVLTKKDDTNLTPLPAGTLTWQPFQGYDVTLAPYSGPATPGAKQLLQLRPVQTEAAAFYAEFGADLTVPPAFNLNASVDFVGAYRLPLDEELGTVTILYYGQLPADPRLVAIFLRTTTISTTQVAPNLAPLTWRSVENPGAMMPANTTFNLLKATTSDGIAVTDTRIIPAVAIRGQVSFEYGQSAARLEAAVTAIVPHPKVDLNGDPAAATAQDEIKHDLANYNSLNVYAQWGDQTTEVTNHAEVLPYNSVPDDNAELITYSYVYRKALGAATPPPVDDLTLARSTPYVAAYFRQLFARAGRAINADPGRQRPRHLTFDVEHTYGSTRPDKPATIASFPATGLDTVLPFPVSNAASVRYKPPTPPDATTPTKILDDQAAFTTITYDYVAGIEKAVIIFRTEWLDQKLYGTDHSTVHVDAWRSIAEIANAESIDLRVSAWTFDFRGGVGATNVDESAAFAQCLTPLTSTPIGVSVTKALQKVCRTWFDAPPATATVTIEIPLTGLGLAAPLGDLARIVRFDLSVTRSKDYLGWPNASNYAFYRAGDGSTSQKDNFDQIKDPGETALLQSAYQTWWTSLRQSAAPIRPNLSAATTAEIETLGLLFGATDNDSRHWIFPEVLGAKGPQEQDSVTATLCPISFLPFANDAAFGDKTYILIDRYLQIVDAALAGKFPQADAAGWRSYFNTLSGLLHSGAPLRGLMQTLVARATSTPGKGATAATQTLGSLADAALASDTQPLRTWLRRSLYRSLRLFSAAEALLLTKIANGSGTLPAAFAEYLNTRITAPDAVGALPTESHTLSYRELIPLDATSFGTIEVLDELHYAEDFIAKDQKAATYQAVMAPSYPPAVGTFPLSIPKITVTRVDLPNPAPDKVNQVELVAREAVLPPIHLYTGSIESWQHTPPAKGLQVSVASLMQGTPSALAPGSTDSVIELCDVFWELPPLEATEARLTAIFTIRGDEAATTGNWFDDFNDDGFAFSLAETAYHPVEPPPSLVPAAALTFFTALGKTADPMTLPTWIQALDPAVISCVASLVQQAPPPPDTTNPFTREAGFGIHGNSGDYQLVTTFTPPKYAIALFRTPGTEPTQVVVAITMNAPVWKPIGIALQQSRDTEDFFKTQFQSVSNPITDYHLHRPAAITSYAILTNELGLDPNASMQFARTQYSGADLIDKVNQLLRHTGHPDPFPPGGTWTQFTMSLTLHFHAKRLYPQSFSDGDFSGATPHFVGETTKSAKLAIISLKAPNFGTIDFNHSDIADNNELLIDLQFYDEKNWPFFRLEDLPAILPPRP